jgi:hypothetical protein
MTAVPTSRGGYGYRGIGRVFLYFTCLLADIQYSTQQLVLLRVCVCFQRGGGRIGNALITTRERQAYR